MINPNQESCLSIRDRPFQCTSIPRFIPVILDLIHTPHLHDNLKAYFDSQAEFRAVFT